jgi:hypothetical protein
MRAGLRRCANNRGETLNFADDVSNSSYRSTRGLPAQRFIGDHGGQALRHISRWRIAATGLVAAGVAVLGVGEQVILAHTVAKETSSRRDYTAIAGHLRGLGIRPPCALAGDQAQPIAFYAGCASPAAAGRDKSTTYAGFIAATHRPGFASLTFRDHRPTYAASWHTYTFTTPTGRRWRVYLPTQPATAQHG